MLTIQYVGPHDIVAIAATGQEVEQNGFVDIDDHALAMSLCEQVDNWKPVDWSLPELIDDPGFGEGVEMHEIVGVVGGPPVELVADGEPGLGDVDTDGDDH